MAKRLLLSEILELEMFREAQDRLARLEAACRKGTRRGAGPFPIVKVLKADLVWAVARLIELRVAEVPDDAEV